MDRTLFTPAMIETWQVCKKAYELAFLRPRESGNLKLSTITKRILLKGFAEIHRGNIKTVPDAQKFLGSHWKLNVPADAPERVHQHSISAFRFAYAALTNYVQRPYKPAGGEIVGVNIKLRARIPQSKAYIEDVFDLIIWHPEMQTIEIVDYQILATKPLDKAWPGPALLIKQFLAEKIQARYPFKKIKLTRGRMLASGVQYQSVELDDTLFRTHWEELAQSIEEMKSATTFTPQPAERCHTCQLSESCPAVRKKPDLRTCEDRRDIVYRSA